MRVAEEIVIHHHSATPQNETPEDKPDTPNEPLQNSQIFTVTFNSNAGSPIPVQKVQLGSTLNFPEIPTRSGWIFCVWYKDESFCEFFIFGSEDDKIT